MRGSILTGLLATLAVLGAITVLILSFLWAEYANAVPELCPPAGCVSVEAPRPPRHGLPSCEVGTIYRYADDYDVDPRALIALRVVENGGPGREFGVLSVPAPTFHDQARVAAVSFRNAEHRYRKETGLEPVVNSAYSAEFLRFFSARWAPEGAENDPDNLNAYHAGNLVRVYESLAS